MLIAFLVIIVHELNVVEEGQPAARILQLAVIS